MPTVMLLGLVSTMFVAGMFSAVMPIYQKVSQSSTNTALRVAAEAAADWSVAQLQTLNSPIDDANWQDTSPAQPATVPASVLGSFGHIPVTATVRVQSTACPQSSYLYDPQLQPGNAASGIPANTDPGWRIVTITARVAGIGRSKTIRVVLKPNVATAPVFNYAMFANEPFDLGNTRTDRYNSALGAYNATLPGGGTNLYNTGADVGTNGNGNSSDYVHLSGNTNIGGHFSVTSNPSWTTSKTVVDISGNAAIQGGLMANGDLSTSGNWQVNGLDLPAGTPSVQENLRAAQKVLPSVPSAPASATSIPAINLGGSRTMTLNSGDYVVPSINITGSGKLIVNGTSAAPVRLWIQGANPNIHISGSGVANSNGVPSAFQIFSSLAGPTIFSGTAEFRGVVYVPNSLIQVSGNGDIYGALVGRDLHMSGNGAVHYDEALRSLNTLTSLSLSRRQIVSWQEL